MIPEDQQLKPVYATEDEAKLLHATAAIHQRMVNDSIAIAGSRGPICIAHAVLHTAAQIAVQRALSKESFQQMVDMAWDNALQYAASHGKENPDA